MPTIQYIHGRRERAHSEKDKQVLKTLNCGGYYYLPKNIFGTVRAVSPRGSEADVRYAAST